MDRLLITALAVGLLAMLAACDEPAPEPKERVRALKTVTIVERAGGSTRTFSGTAQAVDSSNLSFEVAGNIVSLTANAGDAVSVGQVLATLDTIRFQLDVDAAEASVGRTRAILKEKQTEFERQQTLFKKGWVSQAALDQARAAAESATNDLSYANSQLNLAMRDLQKTELLAPFSGIVAERKVEPFEEISRGEPVYSLYADGAMEIHVSVPETSINALNIGLPAEIRLPSGKAGALRGAVSEIGTSAEAGNTYPVKVAILDAGTKVLPGMTAAVTLTLGNGEDGSGFLVPAGALVPGEKKQQGYVFRFDEGTSTVQRVPVRGKGLRDNMVVITEGIAAGDVIAVAGVSFLRDGQKVKLLAP